VAHLIFCSTNLISGVTETHVVLLLLVLWMAACQLCIHFMPDFWVQYPANIYSCDDVVVNVAADWLRDGTRCVMGSPREGRRVPIQFSRSTYGKCQSKHCHCTYQVTYLLWHCWLGVRKRIWPVQIEWWDVGAVICLERGADFLHMIQLMTLLPKTPSSLASFKSRLVLPFWYWLTQVVLEKRLLNGCSGSSTWFALSIVSVVVTVNREFVLHIIAKCI